MRKRSKSLLISVAVVIILTAVVLCACTGENKYTVKYIVDGQVYTTASVNRGGKLQMPNEPQKSGYRFDGWYLDDGVWTQPFNSTTAVIADISVYAHWLEIINPEPQTYVITFDSKGGSSVPALRVREGQSFVLPAEPEKADYTFAGWYVEESYLTAFTADYGITRDMTVYAKWTLKNSDTYFTVKNGVLTGLTEDGKKTKELALPATVDGVTITAIGDGLFENNTTLESVSFPKNSAYTTIGERAFAGCTSLKTFKFSNSVQTIGKEAFEGCKALASAQLPTELKRIEDGTFRNCEKLANVVALRIEHIGSEAFNGCRSLVSFAVPSTVTEIGSKAFYNCYGMTSLVFRTSGEGTSVVGVRKIGDRAFCNCKKLKTLVIPDTVTELGVSVFGGCSEVTALTVGAGVTALPEGAFQSMPALESVAFAEEIALKSIGKQAFSGAKSLKTLVLPSTVTELGIGFLYNASALETFSVPIGVTAIPESAFENCIKLTSVTMPSAESIGARAFKSCVKLGMDGLTLPSTIKTIGAGAFRDCTALASITLPSDLTAVQDALFMDCTALATVDFSGASVTKIGISAFSGCAVLTSVVIPDSVTEIADGAYYGCLKLTDVVFGAAVAKVGSNAFAECAVLARVTFSVATQEVDATAFAGCKALSSVTVPSANTYFKSVNGVLFTDEGATLALYPVALTNTVYTLPSGVKYIADGVFANNTSLVTVVLPEGIIEIGNSAFKDCTNLTTVNYPVSLRKIGDSAFENCNKLTNAKLNQGLHTLGAAAFRRATALQTAELPATLVSVGKNVFEGLEQGFTLSLDIPADTELPYGWNSLWVNSGKTYRYTVNRAVPATQGDYKYVKRDGQVVLLAYTGGAEEVTVPSTIDGSTVIGLNGVFGGNANVKKITLPDTVEVVADGTFRDCTSLTSLVIPFAGAYRGAKGVGGLLGFMFGYSEEAKIGWVKQPASGGNYNYYYTNVPDSLTDVVLTDCTVVAHGAFGECRNIRNITLPEGLETIGAWAFNNVSVRALTIPSSVKSVGENAFTRSYLDYYKPQSGTTVDPTLVVTVSFRSTDIPEGFEANECFALTEDKTSYGKEGVRIEFAD